MDKPLVSFIVTYHNEPAEMIEQCLDSIMYFSGYRKQEGF